MANQILPSSNSKEPLAPYLPEIAEALFSPVQPPLKWAGGKASLLPQMRPHFPKQFNRYHEPFLGGGAVFFRCVPQWGRPAFLSDLNAELINFYRVLRDDVESLLTEVRALNEMYLQASEEERKILYYTWRNADREPDFQQWSLLKRAVRFYFLNRTAFNGLYRINQRGLFNVPWGGYKRPALYRPQVLRSAAQVLQRFTVFLEDISFEIVLENAQSGDFVYLDPPYAPLSSTAAFTTYTSGGFGEAEQKRLAEVCRELDRRGVMFLLSNSDLQWVRALYSGFAVFTVQARRNINSKGNRRGPVNEILVRNY